MRTTTTTQKAKKATTKSASAPRKSRVRRKAAAPNNIQPEPASDVSAPSPAVDAPEIPVKPEKKAKTENKVRRYRAGSQQGVYFERLLDGQPHTLAELSAGFDPPLKYPADAPWYINMHGKEDGTWAIERDKAAGTYRLVLTAKGKKALGLQASAG